MARLDLRLAPQPRAEGPAVGPRALPPPILELRPDVSLEPGTVDWEASVISARPAAASLGTRRSVARRPRILGRRVGHSPIGWGDTSRPATPWQRHKPIKHAKNVVTKSGSMATLDAELSKTVAAIKGSNKELSAKTEAYRQAKRRGSDPSGGKSPHGGGSLSKEALSHRRRCPPLELSGGRGAPAGAIAVEVGLADPPGESGARGCGAPSAVRPNGGNHRGAPIAIERRTSERGVEVPRRSSSLNI